MRDSNTFCLKKNKNNLNKFSAQVGSQISEQNSMEINLSFIIIKLNNKNSILTPTFLRSKKYINFIQ